MVGDMEIFETTKLHLQIEDVIYFLPSYAGMYDPKAYIDWELKLDKEFKKYELSEEEKVIVASANLVDYALTSWKHLLRHDKVPKTWKDMKRIFRERFVPEYYANHMFDKLNSLEQGKNSVDLYYHNLKFHMLHCGLEECEEATEIRFLKGLNVEIRDRILHEMYDSLSSLIALASKIEIQLTNDLSETKLADLLPTYETDANIVMCSTVTNFGQNAKALFAHQSKEELFDTSQISATQLEESEQRNTHNAENSACEYDQSSLIFTTRLVQGHDDSVFDDMHAETRRIHCIASEKEELKIISSLNCLGYIELDFLCDLNSLENKLYDKSGLPYVNNCSLHGIGKYDSKGEYFVHKV